MVSFFVPKKKGGVTVTLFPERTAFEIGWAEEENLLLVGMPSNALVFLEESLKKEGEEAASIESNHILSSNGVLKPYRGNNSLSLPVWALNLKVHRDWKEQSWEQERESLNSISLTLHFLAKTLNRLTKMGTFADRDLPLNLLQVESIPFEPSNLAMEPAVALMPPLVEYLDFLLEGDDGLQLHEPPSLAMQAAWKAMSGEEVEIGPVSRRVGFFVDGKRIYLNCAGNAATLSATSSRIPVRLRGHNIDFVDQQLVALVGLASLCDEARLASAQKTQAP